MDLLEIVGRPGAPTPLFRVRGGIVQSTLLDVAPREPRDRLSRLASHSRTSVSRYATRRSPRATGAGNAPRRRKRHSVVSERRTISRTSWGKSSRSASDIEPPPLQGGSESAAQVQAASYILRLFPLISGFYLSSSPVPVRRATHTLRARYRWMGAHQAPRNQ